MAEIEKINNTELSVKVYQGQRVVTFKDIDMVHERPEGTARKRFNDNKKHFIEGEDFYKVKCNEVRPFFGQTLPNGFNPDADINLITESGYLMLVKSFTDDLAWDVQRQLVKSYFRKGTGHNVKHLTINSREIAKITGKPHSWVLQGIRERIADLQETGFDTSQMYIEASYMTKASNTAVQYLCTEQGCEDFSRCLEPDARKISLQEFQDRFERMGNVLEGRPVKKLPKLISMDEVEEKEPQIQLYKAGSGGIVLLDGEVYSLEPDEIEALSRFIPEMQKYNIGQVQYAVHAFLKSMKKSSGLEKIASWGLKQEEVQKPLLQDKAVHKPAQKLQTDGNIALDSIENLTELQAKTRYNIGRNNLLRVADEAGAVVKVGIKRLYSRQVLDSYFRRHAE